MMKSPRRVSLIVLYLPVVMVVLLLCSYVKHDRFQGRIQGFTKGGVAGGGPTKTTESSQSPASRINSTDLCAKIPSYSSQVSSHYRHLLEEYSDSNKFIIIAYVNNGYVDCAINLFVTSVARFNINNYVFISSDERSCLELAPFQIHCEYLLKELNTSNSLNKASVFNSIEFNAQTKNKAFYVRDALALGYTVLSIDLDIVFIQNPIPLVLRDTLNHDIAFQMDNAKHKVYNIGFYLARPTPKSYCLFHLWCRKMEESNVRDQPVLNELLSRLQTRSLVKIFKLSGLYKIGCHYWGKETNIISYVDPLLGNSSDIIVHNNFMGEKLIKVYRFKEKLLWRNDINSYYSNTSAKYIMYDNLLLGGNYQNKTDFKALRPIELRALANALSIAYILNRIVILPVFHCYSGWHLITDNCTILQHKFVVFDNLFEYREHVFLHNPLTAGQIKQSRSRPLLISSNANSNVGLESVIETDRFVPKNKVKGATVGEIIEWFGDRKESVLNFYSMHNTFEGFPKQTKYTAFTNKLSQLNTA